MDITKIDKNFKDKEVTSFASKVFKLPCEPFSLYGGFYNNKEGFIKMPYEVANKVSPGVLWGSRCGAGTRVLFSTDSKTLKLSAKIREKLLMYHMAFNGSAGFTLCEVENGKQYFVCNFTISMEKGIDEFTAQVELKGEKIRNYILYFPLYSGVISMQIELDKDSTVQKFEHYKKVPPILYYGSSITQGGCASRGDNCYQAYVSEWTKTDYLILGFSGSAKAEKEIADYIRDIDCSIFVCDYDHNAPTVEHLKNTHKRLYEIFRSGKNHKNTPIILLSRPNVSYKKDCFERERYKVISDTYNYAKSIGDNNVYIIDGSKIYPEKIREHCSVDGVHPTDLGFYYMAKKLYGVIKNIKI